MSDDTPIDVEEIDVDSLPDDDGYDPCEEGENLPDEITLGGGALAFGTRNRHVLATWLPAAFDKWGVKYRVVTGWANRGRPLSAGFFDPNGLLIHHTGSTSSATNTHPSLGTVTTGRSDLKGPLCQISTGYDGVTVIVAAGRANHAGNAKATMGNPAGDGNAMYLGNEVATNGTQPMPKAQYDALVLSSAAILDHYGYEDASKLGLHHTTSLSGKWDLGAGTGKFGVPYSITKLRVAVTARLKAGPPSKPVPPVSKPTVPTTPVVSQENEMILIRAKAVGPEVYKTDGYTRQHVGPGHFRALQKAYRVLELGTQAELDAFGPVVPNPQGQK